MDGQALGDRLSAAFLNRARRLKHASAVAKMTLLVVGAAIAGIAQFAEFEASGPSGWKVAGIAASVAVALGTLFSLMADDDPGEELALARQAVEEARAAQARLEFLGEIDDEFTRAIELYQVMNLSRGVIERSVSTAGLTEEDLVRRLLEASERSAAISMNFAQADQWTICIYRAAKSEGGKKILRCIAQHRAIKCDMAHARTWEAGTGIAGVAFSNNGEVIIPDLQTTGLRAVFGTSANAPKPEDAERYRSMVAVPVLIDGEPEPWGVVTATNDRIDHFDPEDVMGVRPVETVRALANMVALAIAVYRSTTKLSGQVVRS